MEIGWIGCEGVREDINGKVMCKQIPERCKGTNYEIILWKGSRQRTKQVRRPKAGACLACLRNKEAKVAEEDWAMGRGGGDEVGR